MLDVGCGSGILAIASMLLARKAPEACDVDAVSVKTARRNCEKNGVSCRVYQSDLFGAVKGKLDVEISAEIAVGFTIGYRGTQGNPHTLKF